MAKIGIKHPIGSGGTTTSIGYISSIIGEYKISTNTTPPPNSGQIRYDNATQISATNIYVHDTSDTGVDSAIFLALLKVGAKVVIQDADDHANIQIFEITSLPTDNTTYYTIPVTLESSNGTGTTGFSNNHRVFLAAFNPETDEKVKVSANDTTEGYLNGKLVAGTGVTLTENNDGGNETLTVATTITQYTDEMAQDAVGGIFTDSSEIDFTYNDGVPSVTASIVAGSIDETKLDASVNASLDLADTAVQPAALSSYAKLDSTNQPFTSSGQDSLNTSTRRAYDASEILSIDWADRSLMDENGVTVVSWDENHLYDASSISSINWFARVLNDATGSQSIDYATRLLIDSLGQTSLDYENRLLKKADGSSTFDFENLKLPTLTTNGIVTTNLGDGSLSIKPNLGGFNCTVNVATGTIQTGVALRFRAPYDFQASEWFMSSIDGGDVQLDVLRSAVTWPVFTSDSICNSAYPELISGSDTGSGSATTWDPIDKDDFIVILIYTVSNLEDFTLQVIGDKI